MSLFQKLPQLPLKAQKGTVRELSFLPFHVFSASHDGSKLSAALLSAHPAVSIRTIRETKPNTSILFI